MKKIALFLFAATMMAGTASAQIDLAGNWVIRLHEDWQDRSPGPDAVDYLGLPINAEARARALRYSASVLSMPERQCIYYPPYYVVFGPQGLRLWADTDPSSGQVVAWNISAAVDRAIIKIWMDGRPHPSENALHTFAGFATGVWEGNTLTARVTHFKDGYLRRNGVPTSDKASFTMHMSRHADTLTVTAVIEDPVYLTRSHVVSRTWQLDPTVAMSPTPSPCAPEAEVASQDETAVAAYPLGENPSVKEMTTRYHIPVEAVLGGAETLYPEYRKTLKDKYEPPAACIRYCCGWNPGSAIATAPNLQCLTGGAGILNER
jgi:hypothetical protein